MSALKVIYGWNYILMVAITGWLVAQILKTAIDYFMTGTLDFERMVGSGGMPSSHSSTVCSMAVATGRYCGIGSPFFAIAVVVAIIVMYDARGVRRETGEQAKVINQMMQHWVELSDFATPWIDNKQLKEMVGHTPLQVLLGALLGIGVAFLIPVV